MSDEDEARRDRIMECAELLRRQADELVMVKGFTPIEVANAMVFLAIFGTAQRFGTAKAATWLRRTAAVYEAMHEPDQAASAGPVGHA